MPSVFITGTDTECGKTHVATAVLHGLRGAGQRAVGYKPVAAGCESTAAGLRNADGLQLQAASIPGVAYEAINPVALEPAIAPHLAAADRGLEISLSRLLAGAQALTRQADWVVVEGAGGFLVPLTAELSFADLVAEAGWPVILVVGMRLGCINHALLSAEAIRSRGTFLGWVANVLPPVQERVEDNIASLRARLGAPCLGVVTQASPEAAAGQLDMQKIITKLRKTP